MKKVKLIILIMSFFVFTSNVFADTPTGSSSLSYSACSTFADGYKTIDSVNGARGEYYYKTCKRATCEYGVYRTVNMAVSSGYRCNNGNGTPYVKVTSDGCSSYTGTCNTSSNATYCTTVTYVDCQRSADGSAYSTVTTTTRVITEATTTKATTKKTTTTTTRKSTTKKSTTSTVYLTTTTTEPTTTTTTTTTRKISSNTNLSTLVIAGTDVKVDNNKDSYTIKIPEGITSIDIEATAEDEYTTIEIVGNDNLVDEEGIISINITAEDGTKRTVTLNVKRYSGDNDDCTLANIYINDYPLDFDKNIKEYTLTLPKKVKSLDIEVVPTDELNAKYEINGNEKLKNNSVIDIVVVSENGTKCNYSIKISKNNNTWKYIVLIILLIAALIVSTLILYKYLKKSKGRYKYE
jgi:hypothetical protein